MSKRESKSGKTDQLSQGNSALSAFGDWLRIVDVASFEADWRELLQKDEGLRGLVRSVNDKANEETAQLKALVAEITDEVMAVLRERAGTGGAGDFEHVRVPGLAADVDIAIDKLGVAHIRAVDAESAYFAQGYVTAQDRLWQMDMMRRIALGRAAEVLGETLLESDRHFRVYGFEEVARKGADQLRPDVKAALEAFAKGVNARMARFAEEGWPWEFRLLRYEPEPWTAASTILVGKLQAEALSANWINDMMRAEFVDLPDALRAQLFTPASPLDVVIFGSDKPDEEAVRPAAVAVGTPAPVAERPEGPPPARAESCMAELVARKRARATALRLVSMYGRQRAISNNWVVAGARTQNGAPLVANDPHLQGAVPGVWHMVDLMIGGRTLAGVSIPGLPGILIGRSDMVAWGVTNVGADVQDVYRLPLQAGGDPIDEQEVKIRVSDGQGGHREETMILRVSAKGPIVFETNDFAYALSWPALDPANQDLPAFFDLARATSASEIRDALRSYRGPPQNFLYGCRNGDVGAQMAGCVLRRARDDRGLPHDGTAGGPRLELADFDDLPHVENPAGGFIATANSRTVPLDYPYAITFDWAAPYRARRIVDRLENAQSVSAQDCVALQGDTFSLADRIFVDEVLRMARDRAGADRRWSALLAIFGNWDGNTRPESVATTVSVAMRDAFTRLLLADRLDPERLETYLRWNNAFRLIDRILAGAPAEWLPKGFDSYEEVVLEAFERAVVRIGERLGTDMSQWNWGRFAGPIDFRHPLAGAVPQLAGALTFSCPNGTGGSGSTINAGAFVSMRFVADMADRGGDLLGLPLGQSGDVRSPHFEDQFDSWKSVAPPAFRTGDSAFRSAARRVRLRPADERPVVPAGRGRQAAGAAPRAARPARSLRRAKTEKNGAAQA